MTTTTSLPLPPCRIYDYDDEGVEEDPDLANVLVVGGGEIRRLQEEVSIFCECTSQGSHDLFCYLSTRACSKATVQ